MAQAAWENSFLLLQFHEFYSEVIRQKRSVMSHSGTLSSEQSSEKTSSEDGLLLIHTKLLSLLEQQALEAGRHGGEYGSGLYKEAQYVLAALADEIFLHLDWEEKEAWKSNLLEFKLFGTHVAGDLFFQKVEKLLKERDPAFVEMAIIYLTALSLDFQGKFRDRDTGDMLSSYRRRLFKFIFHRNPDLLDSAKRLFPESYAYTWDEGDGKKLPRVGIWIGLIVLLIIAYFILAHGLWIHLTADLKAVTEHILEDSGQIEM